MKAALLAAIRTIEIVDYPDPAPAPGKVVVRVRASSICGSDLSGYRGVNPRDAIPTILGHEIAGEIVAIGDGVPASRLGARVCVEPNVCCGRCPQCLAGLPNICPTYKVLGQDLEVPGGLAEFVAVNADQVHDLPDNVTAAEGALVQPLAISYHGVVDRAGVREGERVLVLGAGPIGLGALMLCRERGARVIVADVVDDRLQLAERLGANVALRSDARDFRDRVMEATGGRGADVTFEAVGGGQQETLAAAVDATGIRGRIVILGSFDKPPVPVPAYRFKNLEMTLLGSHGHPAAFAPTLALVAKGALPVRELITHTLPLSAADHAMQLLDSRRDGVMKVILEP